IGILGIIRWCLENDLIQQALTIYNEAVSDMIINKKFIVVDNKIMGNDINRMMKGRHDSDRNNTKVLCVLGKTFDNMLKKTSRGTKEMSDFIGRYHNVYKSRKTDSAGNVVYSNIEWTAASVFFSDEFIPKGVIVNIDTELCGKIFSDFRFVTCARNRVNHASDSDTYDKLLISLFNVKCYPFSSYPNTFTPKNIKKDMIRAIDNLEIALKVRENNLWESRI
ncbi:MAG: hypothetical protein K2O14_11920, partial [Oscillospiraceae bacterium]|nr:hypothetical protein [Oscillospiraceae bacterium]